MENIASREKRTVSQPPGLEFFFLSSLAVLFFTLFRQLLHNNDATCRRF